MTSCLGLYQSVLGRLEQMDLEAARGAQVRSHIKWVEEEVLSVFFCRLEKKTPVDCWVSALVCLMVLLFLTLTIFVLLFPNFIPPYILPPRLMLRLKKLCLQIFPETHPLPKSQQRQTSLQKVNSLVF